jgi:hypothetical protein
MDSTWKVDRRAPGRRRMLRGTEWNLSCIGIRWTRRKGWVGMAFGTPDLRTGERVL